MTEQPSLKEREARFWDWTRVLVGSIGVMVLGGVMIASSGAYSEPALTYIGAAFLILGFILGQLAISGMELAGRTRYVPTVSFPDVEEVGDEQD